MYSVFAHIVLQTLFLVSIKSLIICALGKLAYYIFKLSFPIKTSTQ